jgi:hypothetical protein
MHRAWFGAVSLAAVLAGVACTDEVGPVLTEHFVASLTGANERPTPVTSTATATAEFDVYQGIPGIFYKLTVSGVDSMTAAHIHGPADTSQAAGVIVDLYTGTTTGPGVTGVIAQGTLPVPKGITVDSVLALMRSGQAYVNVHTRAHPGGEIRGQVAVQP